MKFDVFTGGPADLTVVTDDNDVVLAAGFRDLAEISRLLTGTCEEIVAADIGEVGVHWRDYLAGDVNALERVTIRQAGTPVQEQVWAALRQVPAGEPVTYGELADVIDRPRAARAVGSACGSNAIAPFVPCHRIIAANGGLGGYGYGLPIKQWLLNHEARRFPV